QIVVVPQSQYLLAIERQDIGQRVIILSSTYHDSPRYQKAVFSKNFTMMALQLWLSFEVLKPLTHPVRLAFDRPKLVAWKGGRVKNSLFDSIIRHQFRK